MNTSVTLDLHSIRRQAVVLVTSSSIVLLHFKIVCILWRYYKNSFVIT